MSASAESLPQPAVQRKANWRELAPRIALVLILWAAARWIFFEGWSQGDDYRHIRFAAMWDRLPANTFETRIPYNAMMWAAFKLFGVNSFSANLPNLFGSLLIVASGMWIAWHLWRSGHAVFLCGLLLAITPMDVRLSTAARAYACPVGFITLSCALLLTRKTRSSAVFAGLAFALAIDIHEINMVFAALFLFALWLVRQRSFRDCLICGLVTFAGFALIETAIFLPWTGDPLYRFHIRLGDSGWHPTPVFDFAFFVWPVKSLFLSKYLGILMPIGIVAGIVHWRTSSTSVRAALLGTLIFWLAITYGLQILGAPKMWRTDRYWNPMLVLVVILAVDAVLRIESARVRGLVLASMLGVNVAILTLKGPSGFEPYISVELLEYARAHPSETFLTDDFTLDDMFLINGGTAPANVFAVPPQGHNEFFAALPLDRVRKELDGVVVLVNPMNLVNDPRAAEWLLHPPGEEIWASAPRYRMLSYLLPEAVRREHPWLLVKLPGRAVRLRVESLQRPSWW